MSKKFDRGKIFKERNLIKCSTKEQLRELLEFVEEVYGQKWLEWFSRHDEDTSFYLAFYTDNVYEIDEIEAHHKVLSYEDVLLTGVDKQTVKKPNIVCKNIMKLETHLVKCKDNQQVKDLLICMADGDEEELTEWRRWYTKTNDPSEYLFDVPNNNFFRAHGQHAQTTFHINFEDVFSYEDELIEDFGDNTTLNVDSELTLLKSQPWYRELRIEIRAQNINLTNIPIDDYVFSIKWSDAQDGSIIWLNREEQWQETLKQFRDTLNNKPTKQIKKEKGKKMKTITKITTAVTTEVKALVNERGAADIIKGKVLYSNVTKVFGRTIVKIPLADRVIAKVSKKMRFKNEVAQLGATLVALVAIKQFYDHDLIANVRGYIVHRLYEIAVEASGIDDVVALVRSHLPTTEETKV